jgi:hypothetical protein
VLAVGHTIARLDPGKILPDRPTRAEYAKHLLVDDDQRGTNLRMSLIHGDPLSETPYDQSKIVYLIVPLPGKVFTPAESAEAVAWGLLRTYQASLAFHDPAAPFGNLVNSILPISSDCSYGMKIRGT